MYSLTLVFKRHLVIQPALGLYSLNSNPKSRHQPYTHKIEYEGITIQRSPERGHDGGNA